MSSNTASATDQTPQVRRLMTPIEEFVHTEVFGGLLLIIAAAAAILWANSPFADRYFAIRDLDIRLHVGGHEIHSTIQHIVNDGLMALFFFAAGLEIKRELLIGELNAIRKAVLPVSAAIGGMLLPALIYLAFNIGAHTQNGWAIPIATDIAFALAILAILGDRVPFYARVLLTSLAIIDDIAAVAVIAMFYSASLSWMNIALVAVLVACLIAMNRLGITAAWPYGLLGVVVWGLLLGSGIHGTIAGVIVAATIPVLSRIDPVRFQQITAIKLSQFRKATETTQTELIDARQEDAINEMRMALDQVEPPMMRLQLMFHPFSTYIIMPAFAFFNAGIPIHLESDVIGPVTVGILLGLVLGKPLGIMLGCWLAVKLRLAEPPQLTGLQMLGVAFLGGIGFTMSVFLANLAFTDPTQTNSSTAAIMLASAMAAILGYTTLRIADRHRRL